MPELPEVELNRQNLVRWLKQGKNWELTFIDSRILKAGTIPTLKKSMEQFLPCPITRKGKYLNFQLGDRHLILHLGMSGKWVQQEIAPSHSRIILTPKKSQKNPIYLQDPRVFSKVYFLKKGDIETFAPWQSLGHDPLEIPLTGKILQERFAKKRGIIKVRLLDQKIIAGVGNIHASEALFRAKINPLTEISSLDIKQWNRIATGIHKTFDFVLKGPKSFLYFGEKGKTDSEFLVYQREGKECLRCKKSSIHKIVQATRSTFFCPHCQKIEDLCID